MATITPSVTGGNWSANAAWTGGTPPTAADDVVFHAGAGNITVDGTSASPSLCRSLDCATFAYAGTLTMGSTAVLKIGDASGGSLTLVAGMTFAPNASSRIQFVSTTTGNTITCGGKTLGGVVFNGSGGAWQLLDTWTNSSVAGSVTTLTAGSLDLNGKTVNFGLSFTTAAAFTLTCGAATVSVTTPSINSSTTLSAASSTWTVTGSSGLPCAMGGQTFGTLTYTGSISGTGAVTGANTYSTLTIQNTGTNQTAWSFDSNQTISGNLNVTGIDQSHRVAVTSSVQGTQRTFTCNGTFTPSNCIFEDISGAGSASYAQSAATGFGDGGGNSGITFTTPITCFWFKDTGSILTGTTLVFLATGGTGGASRIPLPQDTLRFDGNSFSTTGKTVSGGSATLSYRPAIDCTSATNNPTFSFGSNVRICGSQKYLTGMTISGSFAVVWRASGGNDNTLTTGGVSFTPPQTVLMGSNALILGDNFAGTGALTLTSGTYDANTNSATVTIPSFASSNSNTRTLKMGSGLWTLNGTGTIWNTGTTTGLTISNSTGTIEISDTSVTTKTFTSGGISMTGEGIQVDGAASAAAVTFSGAFSIANMAWQANCAIKFTSGTTFTVTGLSTTASSGNIATITATTSTSAATISCANPVSLDWLSLTDNHASGNTPFTAGTNSTLVSNDTNWSTGASNVGSATGTATVTGIGSSQVASVGSTTGTATSAGIGAPQFIAIGSSSGNATAQMLSGAIAQATGTAGVQATGSSQAASVGSTTGTATAAATGIGGTVAVGAATGAAGCAAIGASGISAVGSSSGSAHASASGTVGINIAGTAAGIAVARAIGCWQGNWFNEEDTASADSPSSLGESDYSVTALGTASLDTLLQEGTSDSLLTTLGTAAADAYVDKGRCC